MIDFTLAELLTGLDLEPPAPDEFGHVWNGPEGTIYSVKVKTCSRCRCDESDWEASAICDPERLAPSVAKPVSPPDESTVSKDEAEAEKPPR
jgi:hypothetical protein